MSVYLIYSFRYSNIGVCVGLVASTLHCSIGYVEILHGEDAKIWIFSHLGFYIYVQLAATAVKVRIQAYNYM